MPNQYCPVCGAKVSNESGKKEEFDLPLVVLSLLFVVVAGGSMIWAFFWVFAWIIKMIA
jgi:hypothetical protein